MNLIDTGAIWRSPVGTSILGLGDGRRPLPWPHIWQCLPEDMMTLCPNV